MDALLLSWSGTAPQSGAISWDVALGVGSLVLFVGGITAMLRRNLRPSQALGVLGVALAVAAITALASTFPGSVYRVLIIITLAVAGAAMAVAVATRPQRKIR